MKEHSTHPPDVVTYNSILTGTLLRGGQPDSVLAQMKEVSPPTHPPTHPMRLPTTPS